jgi:hypothetical protein
MIHSPNPCGGRSEANIKGLTRSLERILVDIVDKTQWIFAFGNTQVAAFVAASFDHTHHFFILCLQQNVASVTKLVFLKWLMFMSAILP